MKGIWFGDIHSYDDLNLILSKADIPPATAKTNFVDIPGGDGSVDLTESLGKTTYKTRTCKFTLSVLPSDNFEDKKREISNLLNGQRFKITLDKDPDWYWEGRCSVDSYASSKNLHQIVVGAVVAPYKLKRELTRVSVTLEENVSMMNVTLLNERKHVVPTLTLDNKAAVITGGKSYSLEAGTHTILDFELTEGENEFQIVRAAAGSLTATFTYQEGAL